MSRGNPDNLRRAAAAKTAAATARAEQGIRDIVRRGEPMTFRGLAQSAAVSLDFPYRNTEIRQRVEQLRNQQRRTSPVPPDRADPDQPSSVVRMLTAQLAEFKRRHREEVSTLRQAPEAAHGENLDLRRRLGREPVAVNRVEG